MGVKIWLGLVHVIRKNLNLQNILKNKHDLCKINYYMKQGYFTLVINSNFGRFELG